MICIISTVYELLTLIGNQFVHVSFTHTPNILLYSILIYSDIHKMRSNATIETSYI